MVRTAVDFDIPISIRDGSGSFSARLADSVVDLIRDGVLGAGQRLPSTRVLAARLGVTRGSVAAAYDELAAAGYVRARRGSGTVVAADATTAALSGAAVRTPAPHPQQVIGLRDEPAEPAVRWDLTPGRPLTTLIDQRAWRRAWRLAADEPIRDEQSGAMGHPGLRQALADHVRRARGLVVEPSEIFVLPGVNAALRAVATAVDLRGRTATVEDPGYRAARVILSDAGSNLLPVPVDDDGLVIDALPGAARLAYVTPSHQYPLGGRLPVGRRAALLRWADRAGAVVVEDDYDGEFRYDVPPLPLLATLDGGRDRVAYVGTFSKTLAPELRVAWLVPPPHLRAAIQTALERSEDEVPRMVAAAVERLLAEGAVAAHLLRARRRYAARRNAFVTAIRRHCPGLPILGVEAGLHVVLRLPDEVDDVATSARLLDAGVRVPPLAGYRVDPALGPRGLVCGYSRLPERDADGVAASIRRVCGRAAPRSTRR